jgi:hypothetical protein
MAVVPDKNGIAVELTVELKGWHFPRAFRGLGELLFPIDELFLLAEMAFFPMLGSFDFDARERKRGFFFGRRGGILVFVFVHGESLPFFWGLCARLFDVLV